MTDIDTSPEAVERWTTHFERIVGDHLAEEDHKSAKSWKEVAALLRQLAKERDEARNRALMEAIEAMKFRIVSDEQDAIAILKAFITPKPEDKP
jgi:hypothetical protein